MKPTTALLVGTWLVGGTAHAEVPVEARIFADVSTRTDRDQVARPFLRFEHRFREDGLSYLKSSLGVRAAPTDWLGLSLYGAHVDAISKDTHDELIVGDLALHHRAGPVSLNVRLGNEWHAPSGFYRYRQLHELRIPGTITPWVQEELRLDSDEGRMTMNNVRAGIDLRLGAQATVVLQADWEASRRGDGAWHSVLAPGVVVASRW